MAKSGQVVPFTERAARMFAQVRAQQKVSSPDAIHFAIAASAGVDLFVTGDARLKRVSVPGIGRVVDFSYKLV